MGQRVSCVSPEGYTSPGLDFCLLTCKVPVLTVLGSLRQVPSIEVQGTRSKTAQVGTQASEQVQWDFSLFILRHTSLLTYPTRCSPCSIDAGRALCWTLMRLLRWKLSNLVSGSPERHLLCSQFTHGQGGLDGAVGKGPDRALAQAPALY